MEVQGPSFRLKWFRIGEKIPFGSRFVKSEKRKTGKTHHVDAGHWSTDVKETEEQYLYEVFGGETYE